MERNNKNTILKKAGLVIWLILPFFLLILPKTYFNEGAAMCFSKIAFDMECIGCGMTRAVMHFIHLDFQGAWMFNKLSFIITPLLILVYIHVLGLFLNKKWIWYFRRFY